MTAPPLETPEPIAHLSNGMRYVERLTSTQIDEVSRNVHALWGNTMSVAEYTRDIQRQRSDHAGALSFTGVIDSHGKTVASHKTYRLRLRTGHDTLDAIGIGAVYTVEAYRGQKLAKAMLAESLQRAKAQDHAFALLFSDIGTDYYRRLGFSALPSQTFSAQTSELPRDAAVTLRPTEDFDALCKLYRAAQSGPHLVRTPTSFRQSTLRHGQRARFVMSRDGRDFGYVSVAVRAQALWVEEAVTVQAPNVWLWQALHALADERDLTQVAGWLRPEHGTTPFECTPRGKALAMIRVLDTALEDDLDPSPTSGLFFSALDTF